jgi:PIN domain nuclease of toxin-antitoxin system
MTCLIDTHTFIWVISKTDKLSNRALEIITGIDNDIFVSVVSFWEISLKTSIKRFSFEGIIISDLPVYARKMDFNILEMKEQEACTFANLPLKDNHKDPFDRMIIWQAISRNIALISKDNMFAQYQKDGLQLIW